MTIAPVALTDTQRQQLLEILNKRFRRMTDCALLELERLTRHPVDLAGFQAKSSEIVTRAKAEVIAQHDSGLRNVVPETYSKPVTRREFITYSATSLLGLLLCGTSYGWLSSNTSAKNLSSTITEADFEADTLMETIIGIQLTANKCDEVILEYSNIYLQRINDIVQLRFSLEQIQSLYAQLDETGINVADAIQFVFDLLSLIPNAEKYAQLISTMMEVIMNTPDTIRLAQNTIANLDSWFSNEPDRGLNTRLFAPAHQIIQEFNDNVQPKVQAIQQRLAGV